MSSINIFSLTPEEYSSILYTDQPKCEVCGDGLIVAYSMDTGARNLPCSKCEEESRNKMKDCCD